MDLLMIDLSEYLSLSAVTADSDQIYGEVSLSLRETSALLVKDPRCSAEDNDLFINMMKKYSESPSEFKLLQERPHCITRELIEHFHMSPPVRLMTL